MKRVCAALYCRHIARGRPRESMGDPPRSSTNFCRSRSSTTVLASCSRTRSSTGCNPGTESASAARIASTSPGRAAFITVIDLLPDFRAARLAGSNCLPTELPGSKALPPDTADPLPPWRLDRPDSGVDQSGQGVGEDLGEECWLIHQHPTQHPNGPLAVEVLVDDLAVYLIQ